MATWPAKAFFNVALSPTPRKMEWQFEDASDVKCFDGRGVLYALGTSFGTKSYVNPAKSGAISVHFAPDAFDHDSVTGEHDANADTESASALESRRHAQRQQAAEAIACHARSGGDNSVPSVGAWFVIDLKGRLLTPTHYCYRGANVEGSEHPRSWELQGSLDGEHWTTVRAHKHDNSVTCSSCGSWPIRGEPGAFSQFRILNKGVIRRLRCSGFELYGCVAGAHRANLADAPPLREVKALGATPAEAAAVPRFTPPTSQPTSGQSSPGQSSPGQSSPGQSPSRGSPRVDDESLASRMSATRLSRARARGEGRTPHGAEAEAESPRSMGKGTVAARLALVERFMAGSDQPIPPGAPGYDPRTNPNKGAPKNKRPPKATAPVVAAPLDYLDEWLALDDGSKSRTALRTPRTSIVRALLRRLRALRR